MESLCDELLVHSTARDGTGAGPDVDLVALLGQLCQRPVTYAGGISCLDHVDLVRQHGQGRVHFTIGSSLDIFGGALSLQDVVNRTRDSEP